MHMEAGWNYCSIELQEIKNCYFIVNYSLLYLIDYWFIWKIMNECISGLRNQSKALVLLLWNILKFVKHVVQMCIYIMYGYRQRQVCFFFLTCCCESSYDKFMTFIHHRPLPAVYVPDSFVSWIFVIIVLAITNRTFGYKSIIIALLKVVMRCFKEQL